MERQATGKCSKRGKHWKSQTTPPPTTTTGRGPDAHDNEKLNPVYGGHEGNKVGESQTSENWAENGKSRMTTHTGPRTKPNEKPCSDNFLTDWDNKLLKTLTQFVTPTFDLTALLRANFPTFATTCDDKFGFIGLHTCGNLGVASLQLFISNKNAKFICNVPCCFHLLDEENLFYPNKNHGDSPSGQGGPSKDEAESLLKPSFPVSHKLGVGDSSRFCLGSNTRVMSAYSLPKMVATEKVTIHFFKILAYVAKHGILSLF